MKLALQLVTWNNEQWLPYLFESLKAQTLLQTLPKEEWTMFVLDNGSTDNSVARIKELTADWPVEIIEAGKNTGFACGHNTLFQKHEASFVALINPDLVLLPDTLEKMLHAFDSLPETAAAVTPRLMRAHPKYDAAFLSTDTVDSLGMKLQSSRRIVDIGEGGSWKEWQKTYAASIAPVFGVSGALPLYRSAALRDVCLPGGDVFDSLYETYKEDVDLAFRLISRGYTSYTLLTTVAFHARGTGGKPGYGPMMTFRKMKESRRVRLLSYRNHWYTLIKNEYPENFHFDILSFIWYELTKFGWHVLFAFPVLWQTLLDVKKHWTVLQKSRASIMKKRRLSAAEIRQWWNR